MHRFPVASEYTARTVIRTPSILKPLAAAAVFALTGAAPAQFIMDELPPTAQGLEMKDRIGQKVPLDLPFVDSSGRKITLGDLFNRRAKGVEGAGPRPVVMMMQYFRCPLLCPKTLEEMTTTLNGLDFTVGKDFDVINVSFDPRDTPQTAAKMKADALMAYERTTTDAIRESWSFLTGPAQSSRALADALGFSYRYFPDSGEFSHRSVLFVLTPDGTVSRYLPGLQSSLGEFRVRDMRLALIDASQGRLGSWTDILISYCFHYDPASGAYTRQAMAVMRLGAGGVGVVLAGAIGSMLMIERRRRRRAAAAVPVPNKRPSAGTTESLAIGAGTIGGGLGPVS